MHYQIVVRSLFIKLETMSEIRQKHQTKQELISTIEWLYPIDSEYDSVKSIGEKLLLEAIADTFFDWRDLPEEVLIRYAELCLIMDIDYSPD